jgi:transcriptional regulator with XRE-family HTH domain
MRKLDSEQAKIAATNAKQFRLNRHLTLQEVGGMMGVGYGTVAAWERGRQSVPPMVAIRMSQLSGQPVGDFICKTNATTQKVPLGHGYFLEVISTVRRFKKDTLM